MRVVVHNSEELEKSIKHAVPNTEIVLQEEEYYVSEELQIKCDDISIIGAGKGTVIRGTRKLELAGLERKGDMVRIDLGQYGISRLNFAGGPYQDYWEEYDIPKPHLLEQGPPLQLFWKGKRLNHARYPEKGYLHIEKAVGSIGIFREDERIGSAEGIFIPDDCAPFEQEHIENVCLIGYWSEDWASQRHTVLEYNGENGIVRVNEPYHMRGYRDTASYTSDKGGHFYVLNSALGMKSPGDWYVEVEENAIYLIPYEGQTEVEVCVCDNLITAAERKNIRIENLTLCCAQQCAIKIEYCENVVVKDVEAYHLGAWGILTDWCQNARVEGCHIYYTAGGGISSSGGDRFTLTGSNNFVIGNEVHDIAWWHQSYMAAIEMNGVGVVATGNYLHDVPNSAIMYQGNNHIIEKNKLRRTCTESNDAGGIYAGRDFTCRGNIIRYNDIGELYGHDNRGCIGIYFDDGMCTAEVYGNILHDMSYAAIQLAGGRDFDIHDNIFYNCQICMLFDERVNRWQNIYKRICQHLEEVPYQSEVWKTAYPQLYGVLEDEPRLPKNNKFYRNMVVGGHGIIMSVADIEQYLEHWGNQFIEMKGEPIAWYLQDWVKIFSDK